MKKPRIADKYLLSLSRSLARRKDLDLDEPAGKAFVTRVYNQGLRLEGPLFEGGINGLAGASEDNERRVNEIFEKLGFRLRAEADGNFLDFVDPEIEDSFYDDDEAKRMFYAAFGKVVDFDKMTSRAWMKDAATKAWVEATLGREGTPEPEPEPEKKPKKEKAPPAPKKEKAPPAPKEKPAPEEEPAPAPERAPSFGERMPVWWSHGLTEEQLIAIDSLVIAEPGDEDPLMENYIVFHAYDPMRGCGYIMSKYSGKKPYPPLSSLLLTLLQKLNATDWADYQSNKWRQGWFTQTSSLGGRTWITMIPELREKDWAKIDNVIFRAQQEKHAEWKKRLKKVGVTETKLGKALDETHLWFQRYVRWAYRNSGQTQVENVDAVLHTTRLLSTDIGLTHGFWGCMANLGMAFWKAPAKISKTFPFDDEPKRRDGTPMTPYLIYHLTEPSEIVAGIAGLNGVMMRDRMRTITNINDPLRTAWKSWQEPTKEYGKINAAAQNVLWRDDEGHWSNPAPGYEEEEPNEEPKNDPYNNIFDEHLLAKGDEAETTRLLVRLADTTKEPLPKHQLIRLLTILDKDLSV